MSEFRQPSAAAKLRALQICLIRLARDMVGRRTAPWWIPFYTETTGGWSRIRTARSPAGVFNARVANAVT